MQTPVALLFFVAHAACTRPIVAAADTRPGNSSLVPSDTNYLVYELVVFLLAPSTKRTLPTVVVQSVPASVGDQSVSAKLPSTMPPPSASEAPQIVSIESIGGVLETRGAINTTPTWYFRITTAVHTRTYLSLPGILYLAYTDCCCTGENAPPFFPLVV